MNKDRLMKVREVVAVSPTFQMDRYAHDCGTPACVAGHAIVMFHEGELLPVSHYKGTAQELLGLSSDEADWLFLGMFSQKPLGEVTREAVIAAIDHLLAGGPVINREMNLPHYVRLGDE